jgi:hypothetical protein
LVGKGEKYSTLQLVMKISTDTSFIPFHHINCY